MKIHCVYTPAHEVLYRDWFLPCIPAGMVVEALPIDIAGRGDFLSEEFLRCIRAKIDRVVDSIVANNGQWIVWSDVDILMFGDVVGALGGIARAAEGKELFFQRETRHGSEVNTGFILMHCTAATAEFFREVGRRLVSEPGKNEQAVINDMLAAGAGIGWGYLPVEFVARTHGWPPQRHMVIYHANYTLGSGAIKQKIRQFKMVVAMRRWGLPAVLWAVAARAWEKLRGR